MRLANKIIYQELTRVSYDFPLYVFLTPDLDEARIYK